MKKIAFFVEGLTEQLFLIKFIEEVYDKKSIAILSMKGSGGNKQSIKFTLIKANSITTDTKYSVLIVDCAGDGNLRSYILDQRQSLINSQYSKIIGLRDVFPNLRVDIDKLRAGLYYRLPQAQVRIDFILCVMEIESWFLSEHTHFTRIDSTLSPQLIYSTLAFHPENEDMEMRDNPAEDLHNAYKIAGKGYNKEKNSLERTIDALDYSILYFQPRPKSLTELRTELETFFS